eukprot:161336-Ditylum_brightwellii.AAC.1
MWAGKVNLNKKSLVMLGTSSRKSARILSNIHALSLFEPVARKISSKSCDKMLNLTCFWLSQGWDPKSCVVPLCYLETC